MSDSADTLQTLLKEAEEKGYPLAPLIKIVSEHERTLSSLAAGMAQDGNWAGGSSFAELSQVDTALGERLDKVEEWTLKHGPGLCQNGQD